MKESKKFDKVTYNLKWRKEHKKEFRVDLNIEEYDELCKLLKKNNLTKVQFVRNAFEELKKNRCL